MIVSEDRLISTRQQSGRSSEDLLSLFGFQKLLATWGSFRSDYTILIDGMKEVEVRLQEVKSTWEKPRWGSLQNVRMSSSSVDLSRRVEEINRQLEVEAEITEVLKKMKGCVERISSSSLPRERVEALEGVLEDLKKKVEVAFGALRKEHTEVGV